MKSFRYITIAVLSLCLLLSVISCTTAQGFDTAQGNDANTQETPRQSSDDATGTNAGQSQSVNTRVQSDISELFDIFVAFANRELPIGWDDAQQVFKHLSGEDTSLDSYGNFFVFDSNEDLEFGFLAGNVEDNTIISMGYNLNGDGSTVCVAFKDDGDSYFISADGDRVDVNSVAELVSYAEENIHRLVWESN